MPAFAVRLLFGEMGEALLVNPFDIHAVARAIHEALTMPETERRARLGALRRRVLDADNRAWASGFLGVLEEVNGLNRQAAIRSLDPHEVAHLRHRIADSLPLTVLDAHTAHEAGHTVDARLAPLIDGLEAAVGDHFVLATHLPQGTVDATWPVMRGWVVAERGAFVRDPTGAWCATPGAYPLETYRDEVLRVLHHRCRPIPRAHVIEHAVGIQLVVGRRLPEIAVAMLRETADLLNAMLARSPWHCARTADGLFVTSSQQSTASALDLILGRLALPESSWGLTIGDSFSDESLFRWRSGANVSIAVGPPVAAAAYRVANVDDLHRGLDRLFERETGLR